MDACRSPLPLFVFASVLLVAMAAMDACYERSGQASRCMPKFENAAFNHTVMASNTCGMPQEDFCMQTGSTRRCETCDADDPVRHHSATYLTDFHSDEEPTWWQSQSMLYGVQHPTSINLTLHLGKAFEISYVRLKFYSSRPESFAIYKRNNEGEQWQPYQFYSGSCLKTYGRDTRTYLRPSGGTDERTPFCTDEFSDISPLTGGNVAFSTLEGRPSAYNFDQSPVLQDWVTATDLMISLNRLNTFGDEFFKDAKVLRSYFYAISDFTVGGRCKCHGHASECVAGDSGKLECVCEHNTAGVDCQHCAPFHHDRPWARATADHAHECMKCNCSGHANECVFDAEQYRSTGSGGRCVGCKDHTAGPHCEHCVPHFYRTAAHTPCTNCSCNAMGSASLQCESDGVCWCREHVTGPKCDTCEQGFHSLSPAGCSQCVCDPRGSVGVCSSQDGRCYCKENVEGQHCDRCKPGTFNLQEDDSEGCQPCFCFGHSLACSSSNQYSSVSIASDFLEDADGWTGRFSDGSDLALIWKEGEVYLLPYSEQDLGYYSAPVKFLGNQLRSYGQSLEIRFLSEASELLPRSITVVMKGSGIAVSAQLPPTTEGMAEGISAATFTLRLKEQDLRPQLSAFEFRRLLSNVSTLHISNAGGLNYTSQLAGVTLGSAQAVLRTPGSVHEGAWAPWVEECQCPVGFMGPHCQLCAPGYTRQEPSGGPYSRCVPCNCHKHGDCHPETGQCSCTDFTTGLSCERCLDGYYGNALIGSSQDCQPCPCPDQSSCAQLPDTGEVVCTNCPSGQRGTRCEMCEDGFYGDPLGRQGVVRPCVRCDCNWNVDPNALGVCDHLTGHCLKCLGHTAGEHCERCQPGYYGNATDMDISPFQKCKPCGCNPAGTSSGAVHECHPVTGECRCLQDVTGRDCSECAPGFFNLRPMLGCERCNCNPIGSSSPACHPTTGQCMCRVGVQGMACDSCRLGFFGFSSRGCRACNCDPMGSASMQCHGNGTCPCRPGFVGYKCDRCELNYFQNPYTHQCEECPVCYSLIKDQAKLLRSKMKALEKLLSKYDCRNMPRRQRQWSHNHVHQPHVHEPHGHQPHVHEHHWNQRRDHKEQEVDEVWRNNLVQEYRDEDYLPNSIEDFLAIQEAREAFIKQFTQLEASAQALELHLRSVATVMNCSLGQGEREERRETDEVEEAESEGREKEECQSLMETYSAVRGVQKQLQEATQDLGNMVIPFSIPKGPNKWNAAVNESQALAESHSEAAFHMESVAVGALQASNRTYSLLLSLLQDNATQLFIQELTQRLGSMQSLKGALSSQLDQCLQHHVIIQERQEAAAAILKNISSSMAEMHANTTTLLSVEYSNSTVPPKGSSVNSSSTSFSSSFSSTARPLPSSQSTPTSHPGSNFSAAQLSVQDSILNTTHINESTVEVLFLEQLQDLESRGLKLSGRVEEVEKLANKSSLELKANLTKDQESIKTIQEFQQLTDLAEGLKDASLSSVVKAKEVESEASSLRRQLEAMQREWPRRQAQTKAAVKKARVVEDKVLSEANKRTRVAHRLFQAVMDNATQANTTSSQAEEAAHDLAKGAKAMLTQTKQASRMSAQVKSSTEEVEQKLQDQEKTAMQLLAETLPPNQEPEVSLGSTLEKMEAARLQLESYTQTLTDLLHKLEEDASLEQFDGVLKETASRLLLLRRNVDNPALSAKIQRLRAADQEQRSQMARLDQSLQEIQDERTSLQDIALTLPKSCP